MKLIERLVTFAATYVLWIVFAYVIGLASRPLFEAVKTGFYAWGD